MLPGWRIAEDAEGAGHEPLDGPALMEAMTGGNGGYCYAVGGG